MSGPSHVPVLVDRVVALVAPALSRPSAVLVDATVGLGGHTSAILAACPTATVVGLDRDARALELAGERLEEFSERIVLVHAVYDEITGVLDRLGLSRVHGVLF
ncbi:MAG: 16S rRNA (cytosine(1402)-N(4))-methyltransferase, partial [Actinomycetota bacterium]|nr:16S rRNA (cytosine(1402)-N(4))-methyltransferase [Actinomycetota bacterium]